MVTQEQGFVNRGSYTILTQLLQRPHICMLKQTYLETLVIWTLGNESIDTGGR